MGCLKDTVYRYTLNNTSLYCFTLICVSGIGVSWAEAKYNGVQTTIFE